MVVYSHRPIASFFALSLASMAASFYMAFFWGGTAASSSLGWVPRLSLTSSLSPIPAECSTSHSPTRKSSFRYRSVLAPISSPFNLLCNFIRSSVASLPCRYQWFLCAFWFWRFACIVHFWASFSSFSCQRRKDGLWKISNYSFPEIILWVTVFLQLCLWVPSIDLRWSQNKGQLVTTINFHFKEKKGGKNN